LRRAIAAACAEISDHASGTSVPYFAVSASRVWTLRFTRSSYARLFGAPVNVSYSLTRRGASNRLVKYAAATGTRFPRARSRWEDTTRHGTRRRFLQSGSHEDRKLGPWQGNRSGNVATLMAEYRLALVRNLRRVDEDEPG